MGKTCCVGLTVFVRADAGWTGTGGALRCGMHSCLARFITVALVSVLIRLAPAAELTDRWVYLQTNLQVDKNVDDAEALFRRAAKAGYTGVLLADSKLAKLGDVIPRYHQNLARVKRIAAETKVEVIPALFHIGYSEAMLWHDPNLAEALPVKDALMVVQGGVARVKSDSPAELREIGRAHV